MVLVTFENEEGKYQMPLTEIHLKYILDFDYFSQNYTNAKTLEVGNHKDDILKALKLEE